jgi:hypothetical protein
VPRRINDDYRHRTAGFHEETNEDVTHEELTRTVRRQEIDLERRQLLDRGLRFATLIAVCSVITALCVNALNWEDRARFLPADILCGVVLSLSIAGAVLIRRHGAGLLGRQELMLAVEQNKDVLRWSSAKSQPSFAERRLLYREDVVGVIEPEPTSPPPP